MANIIARIGGLHQLIYFIGSTGFIMESSGLKDALIEIYAENSVDEIIQRKPYSRTIRGHLLVHSTLSNIIFSFMELDDVDRPRIDLALNS